MLNFKWILFFVFVGILSVVINFFEKIVGILFDFVI